MSTILFKKGAHCCIVFNDLISAEKAIKSNQFLVIDGKTTALIDPGGYLTFAALSPSISKFFPLQKLSYILASHQDPDIISAVDKWLLETQCQLVIPRVWVRFLPHQVSKMRQDELDDRMIPIPDKGLRLPFGSAYLQALPAHFLHSVGNYSFYDPVSKILFSGDIGASDAGRGNVQIVEDFSQHIKNMLHFHRRYMVSNKVLRFWVNMVRALDVDMIVPQHGLRFEGKEMVELFLRWLEGLKCGIDLIGQGMYSES